MIINSESESIYTAQSVPAFWIRWNGNSSDATIDSTVVRSGSNSILLRRFSGQTTEVQWRISRDTLSQSGYFPAIPNQGYLYGGWLRWENIISPGTIGCRVNWYDGNENLIVSTSISTVGTYTANWHPLSGIAIAPANAAYGSFCLFNNSTPVGSIPSQVWFDDCFVYPMPELILQPTAELFIPVGQSTIFRVSGGLSPYTQWTTSNWSIATITMLSASSTALLVALSQGSCTVSVSDSSYIPQRVQSKPIYIYTNTIAPNYPELEHRKIFLFDNDNETNKTN
ncbi:MAG: hypothetical protein N3A72_01765 [bacterium]|nr:hypothetical protein [bacterium]